MSTPLLLARDVRKSFGEGELAAHVLKGLSFDLAPGSLTALLGPSGSGKSTLFNIVGALLRASSGSIILDGLEITTLPEREVTRFRNQKLGFVFQQHHLMPDFSAQENVAFPAGAGGKTPGPAEMARAAMLLEQVGLKDRLTYRPPQLSGGQKQRVAIARALMNAPLLVLADEPTASLDLENATKALNLLRTINRDQGTAVFISTHDPDVASICDQRLHLLDGRIDRIS
jgi:lipoprotein-releasing system ATP-binding protein